MLVRCTCVSRVACRDVCPSATATMRSGSGDGMAMVASFSPSLIYLILLRSRSSSSFSTRPFIHSFHSFVRSFGRSGELKKELVFRNRPSRFGVIRHEVGTQRPIPRSLSPRAGETRNPGCPSDRPILLLEPSSPRIGTCSSSSSWLRRRRRLALAPGVVLSFDASTTGHH